MNIHPIEGKHIDDIRSPDDIAKVIVCRIRPVPMVTKFLAMGHLRAALDNNMIDVIEIS